MTKNIQVYDVQSRQTCFVRCCLKNHKLSGNKIKDKNGRSPILRGQGVRVSGGHLCEAKAPTETTGETRVLPECSKSSAAMICGLFVVVLLGLTDRILSIIYYRKSKGGFYMNIKKFFASALSASLFVSASLGVTMTASALDYETDVTTAPLTAVSTTTTAPEYVLTTTAPVTTTALCTDDWRTAETTTTTTTAPAIPKETELKAYINGEQVTNGNNYVLQYDEESDLCWLEIEYEAPNDLYCDVEYSDVLDVFKYGSKNENGRNHARVFAKQRASYEWIWISNATLDECIAISFSTPEKIGNYPIQKSTSVTVSVCDAKTKEPLENAEVSVFADSDGRDYTTDADGKFDTKEQYFSIDYALHSTGWYSFFVNKYPEGYNHTAYIKNDEVYINKDLKEHYDVTIYVDYVAIETTRPIGTMVTTLPYGTMTTTAQRTTTTTSRAFDPTDTVVTTTTSCHIPTGTNAKTTTTATTTKAITYTDQYGNEYDEDGNLLFAHLTDLVPTTSTTSVTTTTSAKTTATDISGRLVDEDGNVIIINGTSAVISGTTAPKTTTTTTVAETGEASIKGDANCDGLMNMADVVMIMQSLANPDKYQLSDTGRENADIIGNDGVTNLDALQIQKILLCLV